MQTTTLRIGTLSGQPVTTTVESLFPLSAEYLNRNEVKA